jgi:serine/threonine protein kinase
MRAATRAAATGSEERYQVLGLLGAGGMGFVYEAVDSTLHRRVALKFARDVTHRQRASQQLAREAAAMALPGDARVCAVYDLATTRGRTCLVMEHLVGCTLAARLDAGPLETSEVIDIAMQVALALESVHGVGLVHQDIKPANIFLTGTGLVKLLDFGLATVAGTASRSTAAEKKTRGGAMGTPNYIATERLLQRPADMRSDLFSLGVVIYEMATGRPPFAAAAPLQVLVNVLEANPAPIRTLAPKRPAALDQIVRKLLAREVDGRYRTAAEVRKALHRLAPGAPLAVRSRQVSPLLH